MSDDTDFDETPKAHTDSPQSEEGKYAAFYLTESPGPGRRRLSTDQLPQTILDRKMRRTSRSPSPLSHARAFSTSSASAPLASAPFPGSQNMNLSRPLVANGSCLKTSMTQSPRQPSGSESNASEDSSSNFDNPLQINVGNGAPRFPVDGPTVSTEATQQAAPERVPVVANGTGAPTAPSTGEDASFRELIAMMSAYYMTTPTYYAGADRHHLSPVTLDQAATDVSTAGEGNDCSL
ncbi:hypothetical protein FOXG_07128 [Fusarium oxysporum f. sp. lycopersici 4287]|uniref:Uncharacterized protein n=2 Tax=Fusarium oxysporum TaxID=5507 RepID=A0A0J9V5H0_FUSO4|nr:hypothetical protein FOXG_07128 [Fusarium oxysporum f. sp. lycopersici 4287]KAJ9419508.1 hypothetical protein QL093DRAFT_2040425 [Fusarium oxysporum]KNB06408.1 hypothetical protein FOXG_07128 [Fusarium oxysporum f. sp. lycopersici 4287]